jgi:phospholipase/carboxylesterase
MISKSNRSNLRIRQTRSTLALRAALTLFLFDALLACSRGAPPSDSPPEPTPLPRRSAVSTERGKGKAAGLHYIELIKGNARASDRLPMVVVIHGMGDEPHPDWVESFSVRARIILPQAPKPYGFGYSWFTYRTADAKPEKLAYEIRKAAIQLAQAIVELSHKRPTIGKPIVCGFSQGGMLSYSLALHHPKLFSHAYPVSGFLPEPLWPKVRPSAQRDFPPIVSMHGTSDTVVPFAPDRRLIDHLKRLGFQADLLVYDGVGHWITPEMFRTMTNNLEKATRAIIKQHE